MMATPTVSKVEIPRKFSHVGNYQWKHQILSLSLSLSVQGARREARKQKKKEHNP
jgi:hypothetical protein